jgi:hypothetical protein
MVRFCTLDVSELALQHYILRVVGINSFYFYLAIPTEPYTDPCLPELMRICEFFSLMTALDPDKSRATCTTTGISVESIVAPHFVANEDVYRASGLYDWPADL